VSKNVAKKFRVVIDGGDLRVSWWWDRFNAAMITFFALLFAMGGVAFAGSKWPSPLGLLAVPVVLVSLYTLVAAWVNRFTLYVTPTQLALRSGPLPFPWMTQTIDRSRVRAVKLHVSKSTDSKGKSYTSYNLVADFGGDMQHLVSDDEADVKFLAETVAAHLHRKG
jgi:hypothetical protein